MKNQYSVQFKQWCLMALWVMGLALSARAQPVQPPVIQWQRILEPVNPGDASGRTAIIRNSQGGYSVVTADRRLVSLSVSGEVLSNTPLTFVSNDGTTRPASSAVSPVLAPDGSIVMALLSFIEGWKLQKRNVSGEVIWTSSVPFSISVNYQYQVSSVVTNSDGGFSVFATRYDNTYADPFAPIATYVIITRYSPTGFILGQQELRYSTVANNLIYTNGTRVNKAIKTPDGGFLVVGLANPTSSNSTLRGWAAKLDAQGAVIWQNRYESMNTLDDAAVGSTGSYFLSGYAINTPSGLSSSSTLRVDASGNQGSNIPVLVPYPAFNSLSSITSTPSGYIIANDTAPGVNNGDIRLTNFSEQGTIIWTKTIGGSGRDFNFTPAVLVTNDGYIVAAQTNSTDGDVQGKQTTNVANWIVKLQNPANALTLTQPTYNCQTGAITFNTTGGDGSPITYTAPGISRVNATDNFGTIELGLRNDPKPLLITASQGSQTASYTFDFGTYCDTLPSGSLKLLVPTVNCESLNATIIINSAGGDGSPITYNVPGATLSSPASNTAFVSGCINAANPSVLIQATQRGYSTTYSLDLYKACPNTQFGQPFVTRQIPDLTLSVGQTLLEYDVSPYFTDPNRFLRYNLVAAYSSSAQGMPVGINYSTLGTNSTNKLVAKFSGTAPSSPGVYRVTITAATIFCDPVTSSFNIIVTDQSAGSGLSLTQPTYNCQTGAIIFNTSGGNGTPITYTAPGISRANATDNFGTVEQGLRNDPKPLLITASQGSQIASYTFDFGAFCSNPQPPQPPVTPPAGNALALQTPTYDCVSGAFTFRSSGGDGTPIEYQAAGITGWTTNPNQFVDKDSRTASDVQPFTLMARQNGQTITYTWDLKAACGRANARLQAQAELTDNPLKLIVLGNPVREQLRVLIQGADSQPVTLRLTDLTGRLVESRTVLPTDAAQEQVFELHRQGAGLLLLRASSGTRQHTVKVLRQ